MLIVCPSCEASYEVPESMVRAGRVARCARCLREWTIQAPTAAEPPDRAGSARPAPPPAPGPAESQPSRIGLLTRDDTLLDEGEAPPYRNPTPAADDPDPLPPGFYDDPEPASGRKWLSGVAWLASIAVLAGLVWAGFHFRDDIMRAWPASERLYAALGWRGAD